MSQDYNELEDKEKVEFTKVEKTKLGGDINTTSIEIMDDEDLPPVIKLKF